ncbi:hypothetical protein [Acidocella sp. KAb 2-4]|uniref:hypothetical protein n=1 Tax=Acidocella sp. KAb 2-4 TaxID=2885158 RepID=UPI001D06C4DD|nr:hypothetical protein [Acidocella sp. KAb 2-4]MCB5945662.1 hypothetical protein [Acidocella sp. KAb 2-4]
MITAIGGLLIPVCLWFWRRPAVLLMLVLVYSVFAAAALVVAGGFGLTPALLPAALFIGMFLLSLFNGKHYPAERQALLLLFPFILVVCGALVSSFIMPRLFEGEVLVWPQKVTAFFVRSPLAPSAGNFTQDMYLLADALLTVTAALYLARAGGLLMRLMDVYFLSALVAVVVSLWQFSGDLLHFPYPSGFFLSNPGWAQLSDQKMGWLTRLDGPFSEPAALAGYICAPVSAAGWAIINGDRRMLPQLTFWSGLAVALLTTASTGYITLLAMGALLVLRTVIAGNMAVRRRTAAGAGVALVLGGLLIGGVPSLAPSVAKEAALVLDGTVDKTQSASYQARTTDDRDSLAEMGATYGFGVGWGSNRSSSLLPGLCATIGLWGVAGLGWFGGTLSWQARRAIRLTNDPVLRYTMRGTGAALLSSLISALLSGPTISSPDFYLLLAMLVAATARAQREAGTLRHAPNTERRAMQPRRMRA